MNACEACHQPLMGEVCAACGPRRNTRPILKATAMTGGLIALIMGTCLVADQLSDARPGKGINFAYLAGFLSMNTVFAGLALAVWGTYAKSRWTLWGFAVRLLAIVATLCILQRGGAGPRPPS